jgi:hypothetical protein
MEFDSLSFLVGVVAGLIAGFLGARLQHSELLADMKDRVSLALHQVDEFASGNRASSGRSKDNSEQLEELRKLLAELNEELRSLYLKHTR